MMNTRILELLKTPDFLSESDLPLLESEIQKFPYVQNIKALYLYGIHQFRIDEYPKTLSTTAAYTTDKKILYQFVNKKNIEEALAQKQKELEEKVLAEEKAKKELAEKFITQQALLKTEAEALKPVFIDGEQNRILFEGEENFMNEPCVKIDLESTLESGSIVTEVRSTNVSHETIDSEQPTEINDEIKIVPSDIEELAISDEVSETTDELEESTIDNMIQEDNTSENHFIEEEFTVENETSNAIEETDTTLNSVDFNENTFDSDFQEEQEISSSTENDLENSTIQAATNEEEVLIEEENSSELSFHASEEFLPNVAIIPSKTDAVTELNQPEKDTSFEKYKSEMDRLIAEVEAKMKANKQPREIVEDVVSSEINFAETHDAPHIIAAAKESNQAVELDSTSVSQEIQEEIKSKEEHLNSEDASSQQWVPMSFVPNLPDAVISVDKNKEEAQQNFPIENKVLEISGTELQSSEENVNLEEESSSTITEEKSEERPVFTVSFLSDTSAITPKQKENKEEENKVVENPNIEPSLASNVPSFITTWQSWLKIDRSSELQIEQISVEEIKTKAIEKFIETEPKISQLKDEVNFVVKEKSNDISHLMTETLASIYVMQRLYSKAIKGFEILKQKHPEKQDYFNDKIEEVKVLRSNSNFK